MVRFPHFEGSACKKYYFISVFLSENQRFEGVFTVIWGRAVWRRKLVACYNLEEAIAGVVQARAREEARLSPSLGT